MGMVISALLHQQGCQARTCRATAQRHIDSTVRRLSSPCCRAKAFSRSISWWS